MLITPPAVTVILGAVFCRCEGGCGVVVCGTKEGGWGGCGVEACVIGGGSWGDCGLCVGRRDVPSKQIENLFFCALRWACGFNTPLGARPQLSFETPK